MRTSLSPNECQAEVAFTVLAFVLQRWHPAEVTKLKKDVMTVFADIGDDGILEEAKTFFRRVER